MSGPISFTWDDRGFKAALKDYLNHRKNLDPKKELRRRAKNVGMRLVKIYKDKGVNLEDITLMVQALGDRVRIRPKIRAKTGKRGGKLTHKQMIAAELRARRSAKGFSATGWFPAIEKLGGSPKRPQRSGTGPKRGKLEENLSGSNISETLVNQQPGAAVVHDKTQTDFQEALDKETADMTVYNDRKLKEAARRNGL